VINDCSLGELLNIDESSMTTVLRKKSMKALGICLSFIDQEVINEIIIIYDMSFTQLWNVTNMIGSLHLIMIGSQYPMI
jgi:hypothetical protein